MAWVAAVVLEELEVPLVIVLVKVWISVFVVTIIL
jgi:hypothetical protein